MAIYSLNILYKHIYNIDVSVIAFSTLKSHNISLYFLTTHTSTRYSSHFIGGKIALQGGEVPVKAFTSQHQTKLDHDLHLPAADLLLSML